MENWWENLCKNWCGKSTLGKKTMVQKLPCLETDCKQTSETPAVFRLFTNYHLNYYLQGGGNKTTIYIRKGSLIIGKLGKKNWKNDSIVVK